MLNLLPYPKYVKINEGFLTGKNLKIITSGCDERVKKAVKKLPQNDDGAVTEIICTDRYLPEEYELFITEDTIHIESGGSAGAFYAVQTLRQLFLMDKVPCCHIVDRPDFHYRGFYHDVTRGQVPKVETLKKLIDNLAYYKINSLQLYVEHTFEFKEYAGISEKKGFLTAEEIKELDEYCFENFIEFIPSLSTFGHLYELLEQDRYKHLREIENFESQEMFWCDRMQHHTIDPVNPESFELVKSLIDAYMPLFKTDKFNICCDETFDLYKGKHKNDDVGRLYVDFVIKLVSYLKSKGKTVMMWADILLQHPEQVLRLPDDVILLNWNYERNPSESNIEKIYQMNKNQIVCPGTGSWSRLCESIDKEESNISLMAEYGYKYHALGMLNTNWGDWGNPCSLELAMYGMVLGVCKSWNLNTSLNKDYMDAVNALLYGDDKGVMYIKRLDDIHKGISWNNFASMYSNKVYNTDMNVEIPGEEELKKTRDRCMNFIADLSGETGSDTKYRREMLIACEGLAVMSELYAKMCGFKMERLINTEDWLAKYSENWRRKNKESELSEIIKMFIAVENL